jgi:hypothetical protein
MAKKCLLVMLLLCILGSNSLWADTFGATLAGSVCVMGLGLVLVPTLWPSDSYVDVLCYSVGGAFMLGGLIWFIFELMDDSSSGSGSYSNYGSNSSQIKNNPVFEHLSFEVLPNKTYIGAKFQF